MPKEKRTYRLVEYDKMSGDACTYYTLMDESTGVMLLEEFFVNNAKHHRKEVTEIRDRLVSMGKEFGAEDYYFKTKEGKSGDLVCALYDREKSHLRLYCVRFGTCLVVLGDGGHKPKGIKAYQEKADLDRAADVMKQWSEQFYRKQRDGELKIVDGGYCIEGLDEDSFLFEITVKSIDDGKGEEN